MNKITKERVKIIKEIIKKKKAKVYLEIGVKKGRTFFQINALKKIAVDPNFSFNKNETHPKLLSKIIDNKIFDQLFYKNALYEMTSDEFFRRKKMLLKILRLDVVFIDGLHTYKQSLIDVLNSFNFLRKKGVILLHDCNPTSELEAFPSKSFEHFRSLALPGSTKLWSGDVWKTIVHLRATRDDLNIFVLDCDHGIGRITKGEPENKLNYSIEEINSFTYKDLEQNRKELLNLKKPQYIKKFLKTLD